MECKGKYGDVVDRFLRYVRFDTQSNEESNTTPSTKGQTEFARYLERELSDAGFSEIELSSKGYLMATIPSNTDQEIPVIGFIAHLDTSPDLSGRDVSPRIVDNYDGTAIKLNDSPGHILSPEDFPHLLKYKGDALIVTDGHTLLGADNKAGVAEIIAAMKIIIGDDTIKHGTIRICFTPDEEIGRGPDHFDVGLFGAAFAYTIDGGPVGELEFENFNAAGATVTIHGRNVHPGTAKGLMINSMHLATEYLALIPSDERPENTEGYEGFFHLTGITGDVEETRMTFIIRDHSAEKFEERKRLLLRTADTLNKRYGSPLFNVEMKEQYQNMKEVIEKHYYTIELAAEAMRNCGVTPEIKPIRGGTDGARLSFMGLPCPNIFTGGHNFHGRYEFIPVSSMHKAVEVIIEISRLMPKK